MKEKKTITITILTVVFSLIVLIGATFAYFTADGTTSTSAKVNITTYTSDVLTFEVGNPINIETNQTLFASGKGNATGETYAKTTLRANNKTNSATKNYFLYLNILENDFTYTQNNNTPEILLTITNNSNTPVTNISGLTYKTVTDAKGVSISGYDITTKSGLITLFSNRTVTTTSETMEKWNIKVTFVNYNYDQTNNAGKTFEAKLLLQKDKFKANVSLNAKGGTLIDNSLSYEVGSTYGTLPIPTRTGYNFLGWSKSEYSEVEYVGNDGASGIDTSVKGNNSNLSFEVKYSWNKLPSSNNYIAIFNCYQSESSITTRILQYGPNITYFNLNSKAGGSGALSKTRTINTVYTEKLYPSGTNSFIYESDTNTSSYNRVSATEHEDTIKILDNAAEYLKIYAFKISDNGEVIRNYYPCRNANGVYGLYDQVNNTFNTSTNTSSMNGGNAKSGTFVESTSIITNSHTLYAMWEAIQ